MKRGILIALVSIAALAGCGGEDAGDDAATTAAPGAGGTTAPPGATAEGTPPAPGATEAATTNGTPPPEDLIKGGPENDCGLIELEDDFLVRVLRVRGVGCAEALRVARGYKRGRPPPPWRCEMDAKHGLNVLACGHGGRNVRGSPHALIGRIEGD